MRTVGIVAEYNPFHRGHAAQLAQAKQRSGASRAIVVMSGCFTQRGEPAIFSPRVRARSALLNGADLVVLLPAVWSLRDAEHFALGGISLLRDLGADCLSFGAEDASPELLEQAADALHSVLGDAMQASLRAGLSWPEAVSRAVAASDPRLEGVIRKPNNLLGCCYLNACKTLGFSVPFYPVQRTGAHDALSCGSVSARCLRELLLGGMWLEALSEVPESCRDLYRMEKPLPPSRLDCPIMIALRCMDTESMARLPGISEGIENRMRSAVMAAGTFDELMRLAKTRRYPAARLRRMCCHALLSIREQDLEAQTLPDAAIVLGMRREASELLTHAALPVITRRHELNQDSPWVRTEIRAWNVWAAAAGMQGDLLHHTGIDVL